MTEDHEGGALADTLGACFARVVRAFDVSGRVRRTLAGRRRGRVLAVGKAASEMLAGALDDTLERALLVVPEGTRVTWADGRVDVRFATHPVPGEASVAAGRAALAFAAHGLDLCLVSGGASSLLCAPAPGLTLAEKIAITSALSRGGAPIGTLNLVRRHLSTIKGGGLARAAGMPVLTLILRDVLEGGPHDVGSGPTVGDPTTLEEARAALSAHGLDAPLVETLKPEAASALGLEHAFVATPDDLADATAEALEGEGLAVHRLPPSGADVEELARAYVGLSRALLPGQALVRAAEPIVHVGTPHGAGGRSTHLAALTGPRLGPGVALLCGASDGVDGASGTAGAVVTAARLAGRDVSARVRAFDTGTLHREAGTALELGGHTGLNLCDVHVLARV